jgi:prepilin-type N-terminal cleavage/methylation domain-containing protein
MSRGHNSPRSAFTLLEVLVVILILLILAALVVPNYGYFVAKAEETVCISRMRNLQTALRSYLDDHQAIWPQGPQPEASGWTEFWLTTLEPYGVSPKGWECPTIKKMLRGAEEPTFTLHYVPTTFDTTPNIAYRWVTQPWLIEAANAHGKGPLIAFPDGSVTPFFRVLAEQGVSP